MISYAYTYIYIYTCFVEYIFIYIYICIYRFTCFWQIQIYILPMIAWSIREWFSFKTHLEPLSPRRMERLQADMQLRPKMCRGCRAGSARGGRPLDPQRLTRSTWWTLWWFDDQCNHGEWNDSGNQCIRNYKSVSDVYDVYDIWYIHFFRYSMISLGGPTLCSLVTYVKHG